MIIRKPFNRGKTNFNESFRPIGKYFLESDKDKVKEYIGKDKKFWGKPKYIVFRTDIVSGEGFQQIAPFDNKKNALEYINLCFQISNKDIVDIFMIEI